MSGHRRDRLAVLTHCQDRQLSETVSDIISYNADQGGLFLAGEIVLIAEILFVPDIFFRVSLPSIIQYWR